MSPAPTSAAGAQNTAEPTFVIVGAGQAGVQAAITLREQGFRGQVVLLGDEGQAPYMRPPLSKKFLAGELAEDRLYFRPGPFFESNGIQLQTGVRVQTMDRAARTLQLVDGRHLAYDKLLLATGARARTLPLPGASHPDVHHLRSLDDVLNLRTRLVPGRRLAIVGGGYLGLEVAATAAQAGMQVTVLEIGERLLERVTTPILSGHFERVHRAHGVDVRCATRVTGLSFHGGRLEAVETDRGTLAADLALVAIGALPNEELARAAGLPCEDGILVDESGRTADPDIYAAGDCTRHPNPVYGRRIRLESVQNAVDQATVAAGNMMGGQASYARVPWFWSQQYGLKLQSAGLFQGYDEVVERGDREADRFALLYYRAGQLLAIDAVNMPAEYLAARKTITDRHQQAHPASNSPADRNP